MIEPLGLVLDDGVCLRSLISWFEPCLCRMWMQSVCKILIINTTNVSRAVYGVSPGIGFITYIVVEMDVCVYRCIHGYRYVNKWICIRPTVQHSPRPRGGARSKNVACSVFGSSAFTGLRPCPFSSYGGPGAMPPACCIQCCSGLLDICKLTLSVPFMYIIVCTCLYISPLLWGPIIPEQK